MPLRAITLNGPGATLLLLHGLGGSADSWTDLTPSLTRHYAVIVPDLRGSGARASPISTPVTLSELADDVVEVLDHLGVTECHVVGHSFGGVVAQDLLVRHARRILSATLISTSARVGKRAAERWRRLADSVERRGAIGSAAANDSAFSRTFRRNKRDAVSRFARVTAQTDPHTFVSYARLASSYDYVAALRRVEHPILVMQGLADELTSPAGAVQLYQSLLRGRLELIEGAGHNLHVELGESFTERIFRFLQSSEHVSPSRRT
jgi:3-oxoadipate enol-lactonase